MIFLKVATNIVFWLWCLALALTTLMAYTYAKETSAEAGGAAYVLVAGIGAILLIVSFAARWVVWRYA